MNEQKKKALATALAGIEKQFGKGSVIRMGDQERIAIPAISTGSLGLDAALGIGGLPRGVLYLWPGVLGQNDPDAVSDCRSAESRLHLCIR